MKANAVVDPISCLVPVEGQAISASFMMRLSYVMNHLDGPLLLHIHTTALAMAGLSPGSRLSASLCDHTS